jgi:peptidoglycan/LPS O-acetylase OafA/YrhL
LAAVDLLCSFSVVVTHTWPFPLFTGFFLVGITLEMADWKPSRTTAYGSLLIGINLVLAIIPDKRGFVWRTDSEAIPTSADLLFSAFGRLWMVIGAGIVIPFLAWNVSRQSSRFDRLLGNLAYPLYLFHWIPREWYYHFSLSSDPTWKQCALLAINFFSAGTGALAILFLVDRRSERLRAAWIASRRKKLPVSMPEVGTATLEQMKPY